MCLQTAEFAPSTSNATSCRFGVLHEKRCLPPPPGSLWVRGIWGVKEGKREVSPPTHPARRQILIIKVTLGSKRVRYPYGHYIG